MFDDYAHCDQTAESIEYRPFAQQREAISLWLKAAGWDENRDPVNALWHECREAIRDFGTTGEEGEPDLEYLADYVFDVLDADDTADRGELVAILASCGLANIGERFTALRAELENPGAGWSPTP